MRKLDELVTEVNKNRAQLLDEKASAYLKELEQMIVTKLLDNNDTSRTSQAKAVDFLEITDWVNKVNQEVEVAALVITRVVNAGYAIEERKIIHAPLPVPEPRPGRLSEDDSLRVKPKVEKGSTKYHLVPLK